MLPSADNPILEVRIPVVQLCGGHDVEVVVAVIVGSVRLLVLAHFEQSDAAVATGEDRVVGHVAGGVVIHWKLHVALPAAKPDVTECHICDGAAIAGGDAIRTRDIDGVITACTMSFEICLPPCVPTVSECDIGIQCVRIGTRNLDDHFGGWLCSDHNPVNSRFLRCSLQDSVI